MKSPGNSSCLRFGSFELNPQTGELRKQGIKVRLGQHAFKILMRLVEHPGELRTREDLRQRLWGADTFVNFEQSLNKAIHQLREALGDPASNPHYIETVAGRGYRFIYFARESTQSTRTPRRKFRSVAVLPFTTEPANREMELLSKGIVERLIDTISMTPGMRILAYRTVQHDCEKDLDPRTVGENLLVRLVVAGEMTRSNDQLLLHVELMDAYDGTQLWGARFKETYADVFADPEKLADRICDQLLRILGRHVSGRGEQRPGRAA
jgi:DNA-binding winged helix-turn-helix (wHTH) protein